MRTLAWMLPLAAVALAATTASEGGKANETAPSEGHGWHHRSHHGGHHHGGWGGGGWGQRGFAPSIVDRNVCDLDASVLVVVEGGRRGYQRARRMKCSDIGSADEDSCTICCQNAARRDQSVRNEDIFGFMAVIDHFERDDDRSDSRDRSRERRRRSSESRDDDYNRRNKRDVGDEDETEAETPTTPAPGDIKGDEEYKRNGRKNHGKDSKSQEDDDDDSKDDSDKDDKKKKSKFAKFDPAVPNSNVKCLCCAPRRQLPPPQAAPPMAMPIPVVVAAPIPVQQAPPQYGGYQQQAYAAPAAAPVQQYQAPAQAPAQYAAPVAAAPVNQPY